MTRRENFVRRRPPSRQPRSRILVVCGGARTEPDYFTGLKRRVRNPAVHVKVIGKGVDPTTLVRYAAEKRAHATGDFDEVWCVTDVALRQYVPHYDKNTLCVEDYPDTAAAIERGRRSHNGALPPGPNPSSGVWRLAELVTTDA